MTETQHRAKDRILKMRYGLSFADYQALLKQQKDRCKLCKKKPNQKRAMHVDHDHNTQKVRGLLCHRCNVTLGHFEKSQPLHEAMQEYLQAA